MGHLINPVSSQIKYHGSWKVSWSHYLRKDFGFFFFLEQYFRKLLMSISFLKGIFNKIFFFELRYFIKNNIILFFFQFNLLKKQDFVFIGLIVI